MVWLYNIFGHHRRGETLAFAVSVRRKNFLVDSIQVIDEMMPNLCATGIGVGNQKYREDCEKVFQKIKYYIWANKALKERIKRAKTTDVLLGKMVRCRQPLPEIIFVEDGDECPGLTDSEQTIYKNWTCPLIRKNRGSDFVEANGEQNFVEVKTGVLRASQRKEFEQDFKKGKKPQLVVVHKKKMFVFELKEVRE